MVLITSMGGCGSTNIIFWFSHHIKCNCSMNSEGLPQPGYGSNPQGLKHRISPPLENDEHLPSRIEKAVFLYDSPFHILPSLFQRGIAWGHAMSITGKYPKGLEDLDEFIAEGTDSFGFSRQFASWTSQEVRRSYPRMLIRAPEIWSYLPELLTFLEIPKSRWNTFPRKRQRSSSFDALPDHQRSGLRNIYGDLHETILSQQDIDLI